MCQITADACLRPHQRASATPNLNTADLRLSGKSKVNVWVDYELYCLFLDDELTHLPVLRFRPKKDGT